MRLMCKKLVVALLAVLLVAGAGSFTAQAAGEVVYVDVQAIVDTYILPMVEEALQPELQRLQSEFDAAAKGLADDAKAALLEEYQARLDARNQELINIQLSKLRNVISEVARENGYGIVLHIDAVIVGGTEITSQVVAKWKTMK